MSVTKEVPSGEATGDPAGKPGGRHGSQDDQLSRGHEVPHLQSPRHGKASTCSKVEIKVQNHGMGHQKNIIASN